MGLVVLIFITQALYSSGDLIRKIVLTRLGFSWPVLGSIPFWIAMGMGLVGFLIQLYAFSKYELSKSIILLGTFAVIMSSALGVFYLKEKLNSWNYVGLGLAVLAIIFTNIRTK